MISDIYCSGSTYSIKMPAAESSRKRLRRCFFYQVKIGLNPIFKIIYVSYQEIKLMKYIWFFQV